MAKTLALPAGLQSFGTKCPGLSQHLCEGLSERSNRSPSSTGTRVINPEMLLSDKTCWCLGQRPAWEAQPQDLLASATLRNSLKEPSPLLKLDNQIVSILVLAGPQGEENVRK